MIRFLRFRWIFGVFLLGFVGLGVWLHAWHWWLRAGWLERLEVVGAVVAFSAFEAGVLAVAAQQAVKFKAGIDAATPYRQRRPPWWRAWTGPQR